MTRKLRPCGTQSAYRRHLNRGETPCPECRAANTARKCPESESALRVGEIEMAELLNANPPVIEWVKDQHGIFRAVSVHDPHADKPGPPLRRERQLEVYAARRAVPECTDENLLAAGQRGI